MRRSIPFLLFLSACTVEVANRGYDFEIAPLEKLKVGQTREEVQTLLGSPSSTSSFKDDSWYYISKKIAQKSFFKPETMEQKVIIVSFDHDRVTKVEELDKNDVKTVILSENKTGSSGYETGFMREVFGNFGRFSTKAPTKK